MVAPEDGSSSIGGDVSQQRRSLMAAAIRRGDVRISEPILWVEGVPPNQQQVSAVVEPDQQVAPTATEAGDNEDTHGLAISTDEPPSTTAGGVGDNSGVGPPLNHKKSLSDGIHETIESQPILSPVPDTTDEKSEHKRSIFVEDEMATPSPTSPEKKARRSGTLRTVLRKVFKRKDKRQSKDSSSPQPRNVDQRSGAKHEYTRSDPLPSTRPKAPTSQPQDRAPSSQHAIQALREVELDRFGAHTPVQPTLPFPMNVNAPQPESPAQDRTTPNYISFETSPRIHRRRATLPSMILSPEDGTMLHKMWSTTDLTPIGSASDNSGMGSFGLPSPPIGVAISSSIPHPNRRSRSAGALHELAKYQAETSQFRRRSSEIKYWQASKKDSQQDVRPPVSPEPMPDRSERESSITQAHTEVSEVFAETGSSIHEGHLEPLDFVSVASEPMSPERDEETMEQRLLQLESNMHRLSMSVQEYAARTDPVTEREFALKPAPRTNTPQVVFVEPTPLRQGSSATVTDPSPQRMPSMRYQQPRTVPSPSPSKASYQHSYLSSTSTAAAPASPQATYLKPHIQYPPAPSSVHSAPQVSGAVGAHYVTQETLQEHIAPLFNALRYERQIRKALETQVSQLRNDVVELSAIVAQMRKQATYAQSATNGSARSSPLKGFGMHANGERSRFSGYDSSDDERDINAPLRSPQEQWTTPKEENSRQWGSTVEGADMF